MSKRLPYAIDGKGYPVVEDPECPYHGRKWRRDPLEARRLVARWFYLRALSPAHRRRQLARENKGKVLPPAFQQSEYQRTLARANASLASR